MPDDLELDKDDYAVIVKMRGPADKPWKWEITAPGQKRPVRQSAECFKACRPRFGRAKKLCAFFWSAPQLDVRGTGMRAPALPWV
jgi:hypothetical protein